MQRKAQCPTGILKVYCKGTTQDATLAARSRDLSIAWHGTDAWGISFGFTTLDHLPEIVSWFCEPDPEKTGYPNGTLMFYVTVKEVPYRFAEGRVWLRTPNGEIGYFLPKGTSPEELISQQWESIVRKMEGFSIPKYYLDRFGTGPE